MQILSALADPNRRRIVEMLTMGEMAAGDIAEKFSVSAPAISQHLKALREAGLVQMRVDAQRRIYALNREALADIKDWLARVTTDATEPMPTSKQSWEAILNRMGV